MGQFWSLRLPGELAEGRQPRVPPTGEDKQEPQPLLRGNRPLPPLPLQPGGRCWVGSAGTARRFGVAEPQAGRSQGLPGGPGSTAIPCSWAPASGTYRKDKYALF